MDEWSIPQHTRDAAVPSASFYIPQGFRVFVFSILFAFFTYFILKTLAQMFMIWWRSAPSGGRRRPRRGGKRRRKRPKKDYYSDEEEDEGDDFGDDFDDGY